MARRLSNRKGNAPGHNSTGMTDREALKRYADRVLRLLSDRDEINAAIKEVYEDSKEAGFVTKIVRKVVAEMRMDSEARTAQYNLLDEYRHALGLLADTPLGEATISRLIPRDQPDPEPPEAA